MTTSSNSELEVTISEIIQSPREAAFNAWLDPKMLAEFIRPDPQMPAPTVETSAEVGGKYKIIMHAGETDLVHQGEYKEISKYDRIVFSWLSDFVTPDSTVTLTFEELSPSETKITLHHVGFPAEGSRNNHEGGWANILKTLAGSVQAAA